MANFSEIIGQEQMKEVMKKAVTSGAPSHAYIICGERSSGKEFIARLFAAALQCENHTQEGEPCNDCHACHQAISGNHPDIIRVLHERPNTIGVDDIRSQINNDIVIKPYQGPYKIYIMNEGEKMTAQAQNALLKTLEEPPAYGIILILTSNLDNMLPTILSRCVVLNMKPAPDEEIRAYLMRELQVPDYKADVCVAFARGNVGKAKALATSEEFDNIKEDAVGLLKSIDGMDVSEIIAAVRKITEYKFNIDDYLDIIAVWYRDVLLFKATGDANHLIFKSELPFIREVADASTYEGIDNVIDAIDKAKSRLKANVNFDLTMQLLIMTIKEK
ncbi:MAG: DNA polymerase III subunit [Lachnospiraceae bacterium]|nr:DNA polymerase III subunit [Candidatus Merdinaster equi]